MYLIKSEEGHEILTSSNRRLSEGGAMYGSGIRVFGVQGFVNLDLN
jgi:hypothetical protein